VSESPFRTASPYGQSSPYAGIQDARQAHALREHDFAQTANNQIDDFIAQGRAALDNLVDQRQMLKGTQRRLLDAANTIGLSRDVIGWIERRRWVPFHLCAYAHTLASGS
jgi:Golgi SNAP receptor complex protein 2